MVRYEIEILPKTSQIVAMLKDGVRVSLTLEEDYPQPHARVIINQIEDTSARLSSDKINSILV